MIIGQQPYAIDADGPLARVVGEALAASRSQGIEALIDAFEAIAGRYPDPVRAAYLAADAAAMRAAWSSAITEGPVGEDLGAWNLPCLICVAADDTDFFDQARRAAEEIPNAEFVSIEGQDHLGMDTARIDPVLPAVLRTLRRARRRLRCRFRAPAASSPPADDVDRIERAAGRRPPRRVGIRPCDRRHGGTTATARARDRAPIRRRGATSTSSPHRPSVTGRRSSDLTAPARARAEDRHGSVPARSGSAASAPAPRSAVIAVATSISLSDDRSAPGGRRRGRRAGGGGPRRPAAIAGDAAGPPDR